MSTSFIVARLSRRAFIWWASSSARSVSKFSCSIGVPPVHFFGRKIQAPCHGGTKKRKSQWLLRLPLFITAWHSKRLRYAPRKARANTAAAVMCGRYKEGKLRKPVLRPTVSTCLPSFQIKAMAFRPYQVYPTAAYFATPRHEKSKRNGQEGRP
ncbi:hypothetical protein SDC9_149957 [bioreactor metagenome]|uniref:Uncharacterized protein n=1 Tax=bioreactor metagenome TaxID=1076179 RepID=A0A645EL73_9ZZZZ